MGGGDAGGLPGRGGRGLRLPVSLATLPWRLLGRDWLLSSSLLRRLNLRIRSLVALGGPESPSLPLSGGKVSLVEGEELVYEEMVTWLTGDCGGVTGEVLPSPSSCWVDATLLLFFLLLSTRAYSAWISGGMPSASEIAVRSCRISGTVSGSGEDEEAGVEVEEDWLSVLGGGGRGLRVS